MSKYLFVVTRAPRPAALDALLSEPGWTHAIEVDGWSVLLHAEDAAGALSPDASFFRGWCIDHDRERMVFAGAPDAVLPAPDDPREGAYVTMRREGRHLAFGNDLFCQLPLQSFAEPDLFACSDSLFALTEVRKALGLPCRIEPEVARARQWVRTLGQQNHSDQSLIAGITWSGVGRSLHVTLGPERLAVQHRARPVAQIFQTDARSHRDAIREAAERMAQHLATIAACAETVSCSLSGGHDSRAVFAAATHLRDGGTRLRLTSNSRAPKDFAAVQRVAEAAGMPIEESPPALHRRDRRLATWFSHGVGLYDRYEVPRDYSAADGLFTLGGHGGELLKGMWRWWPVQRLTLAAPLWSQRALRAQCRRGLEAMGLDRGTPASAEWHYLGYRNAIHGGRSSALHLHNGSPLMERSLVALARSSISDHPRPGPDRPSVVTDLSILFRPDLAALPFDNRAKDLPRNDIERRLAELGGPVDRAAFRTYAVHGAPRTARNGSSPLFERLARAHGLAGDWEAGTVTPLALAAAERSPPALRSVHRAMARRLGRGGARLGSSEGVLAARLLGLLLLDA